MRPGGKWVIYCMSSIIYYSSSSHFTPGLVYKSLCKTERKFICLYIYIYLNTYSGLDEYKIPKHMVSHCSPQNRIVLRQFQHPLLPETPSHPAYHIHDSKNALFNASNIPRISGLPSSRAFPTMCLIFFHVS